MKASVPLLQLWRADLVKRDAPPPRPAWLAEAYEKPAEFWEKIAVMLMDAPPGGARSAVFEWYDLFYELGQRHAVGQRVAHLDYAPGTGFHEESYAALTRRARALVSSWRRRGVVPGASVCIVLSSSATCITCLLAAFYCGATVTLLPPEGPAFVRRALKALVDLIGKAPKPPAAGEAPKRVFVVAGGKAKPWVANDDALCLLEWEPHAASESTPAFESHRYGANASAMCLFSPLAADWDAPVQLRADQLYLSALRDGVLLLGLEPGQRVSAPGFCEVQYKPGLLLATLAAGASWLELGVEDWEPGSLFFAGKIDVLGVSSDVRARIMSTPHLPKGSSSRWFRNLTEEDNCVKAWAEFEAKMAATGALGSRWFGNSAAGGSILFSAWTAEPSRGGVWRAPGLAYELKEPNGTGMEPLADVVLLTPTKQPLQLRRAQHELSAAALGRPVIAVTEGTDIWVINLGSHRRGAVLPEQQMEELLQAELAPDVRAAVLVVLPRHGEGKGQEVALLVYVRPDSKVGAADIEKLLETQLGKERVPDRIDVYPLNPKLDLREPEVDRAACAAQYLSGTLWGKRRCPVFPQLARVCLEIERIGRYREGLAKGRGH